MINVAKRLRKRYSTSVQAAVAEALSIAMADGLYDDDNELISVSKDSDGLKVDLRSTFPAGYWEREEEFDEEGTFRPAYTSLPCVS